MDGFIGQDRDLEGDSEVDGKPVRLFQNGRHTVRCEPCCHILNALELLDLWMGYTPAETGHNT